MYTIVDLCLICLTNDKNLNSLLSEDIDGLNVEEKLKFVLSKHVNYDKEISTHICSPCLEELNYVYNYKQLCLWNINRFNSFIQKLKSLDEPYKNLQVKLIDLKIQNKISWGNKPVTLISKVDNVTEQKYVNKDDTILKTENQELEKILTEESEENDNTLEFIDEIIKEESVDIYDTVDIKSELDNNSHSKQIICDICDKVFKYSSALVDHKRIHTGTKPYKCDVCSKKFTQKSVLNRHKRVHTGEKPYQCDVCGKAFSHLSTLVVHERIHNGAKPFKCDMCDKTFRRKSYMVSHRFRHTGEKPYKCNMCETSFRHLSTLKAHKRIHSGVKPFKCDNCDKEFSRKFNLMTHKLCHIKNK